MKSPLGAPVPVKHPVTVEGLKFRCSLRTSTKTGVILALIWRKKFTSVCGPAMKAHHPTTRPHFDVPGNEAAIMG